MEPAPRSLLSPPIGFAHRGASAQALENTLQAFRLALELGASGLESDVWITADGVPVLDHDGVVRDGPRQLEIRQLARPELPPHVPTLRDLYAVCGPHVPVSLDVKDEAAAPAAIAAAERVGAASRLWLCHWNWRVVAGWRRLSDRVKLVDSTRAEHMRTPPERRAARMVQLGIDAINLPHGDWTAPMVEAFHRRDRLVFAWDLQQERELHRALGLGVDAVYSDHVERMMTAIGALGVGASRPTPPPRRRS